MRILDLFCGAGGAAMGYHQALEAAGITHFILGVDIEPQPDYPFNFVRADALTFPTDGFDLIHAPPPCQAFSTATPNNHNHPDLIDATRELISHRPSVIENVRGANLEASLMLCGSMFGMQVQRHRYFEHTLGLILSPSCNHKAWESNGRPFTVTGSGASGPSGKTYKHSQLPGDIGHWQELMDMPWVTEKRGIREAIPPAYTRFIMEQYLASP